MQCALLSPAFSKAARSRRDVAPLDATRPALMRLRASLVRVVADFLASQCEPMAVQINRIRAAMGKAAPLGDDESEAIERILAQVDFAGWAILAGDVEEILAEIAANGSAAALVQIGLDVQARREVLNIVNAYALDYAKRRSAAMVGMRIDELGRLVPNPNAVWQITEGTREYLRAAIRDAIDNGTSNQDLAAFLADSYGFSKRRAMVIARTETNRASNQGSLASYKASGVVTAKEWLTADDDLVSPECQENGEAGPIALDADFPSGDPCPPVHPNCRCTIVPIVVFANEAAAQLTEEISP